MSPPRLLADLRYWWSQKVFVVIIIACALAFYVLFPLTVPRSDNPLALLSLFIHVFSIWGLGATALILAELTIEYAIAQDVDRKASEHLSQIKSRQKDRMPLEALDDLLPRNPERSMIRLFQQILTEAADRKFESSATIMQPYRENAIGDLLRLQTIQRIALQTGILGTFIGLILALGNLSFSLDISKFAAEVDKLVAALHISFSTSIAGLEASVILGFLIFLVRHKQEKYFERMESATVTMISLARNALNKDEFLNEFRQVQTSVEQLSDRIYDQNQKISIQTNEIHNGMQKLSKTKSEFDGFLTQVTTTQGDFIEEMKGVYGLLSPEALSQKLQESLELAIGRIAETFDANLTKASSRLTALNEALASIQESLQLLEGHAGTQDQLFAQHQDAMAKAKGELYTLVEQLSTLQQQVLTEMQSSSLNKVSRDLQTGIEDAGKAISDHLRSDLKVMAHSLAHLNRHLDQSNALTEQLLAQKSITRLLREKFRVWRAFFAERFASLRRRVSG